MYCSKCGAANPDQSKFCSDCGAMLVNTTYATPAPPVAPASPVAPAPSAAPVPPVAPVTPAATAPEASRPRVPQGKLCCPNCGSTQLTVTTDRDWGAAALGGIAGAAVGGVVSGAIGVASNLQQQTFFVCSDCGHRFRNPKELENEAKIYGKRSILVSIVSGVMILLCLILIIAVDLVFIDIFFGAIAAILIVCIIFMNKKAQKPKKELEEIQRGMSRFR